MVQAQRFVGGYSWGVHLFPFRTEKLSPYAPMVLPLGGRVGRCQLFLSLNTTPVQVFPVRAFVFLFSTLPLFPIRFAS